MSRLFRQADSRWSDVLGTKPTLTGGKALGGREGYWQLFDTMAQGAICHGEDGGIIAINPAARGILGTTEAEMMSEGEPQYYWVHADCTQFPAGTEPWNVVRRTGKAVIGILMGFCRSGEAPCRWIIVNANPFPLGLNENIKVFTTFQDVTSQVRLQDQLEQSLASEQEAFLFLQRALRPKKLTTVDGLKVAERYIPADQGNLVSGDIYDAFHNRRGHQCFLIGDVAGKGIQAVACAVAAKDSIRAYAYEDLAVGRALGLTNSFLYARQNELDEFGTFVSAVLLMIDPATSVLHYANAGHPAPILYQEGMTKQLKSKGLILGVQDEVTYHSFGECMQPGSKVVLCTDGLTESRRDGEMFGFEALEECIREHGDRDCEELADHLINAATEWGGKISDDVALLVIERV